MLQNDAWIWTNPPCKKGFGGFYDGSKANVGHYKMTLRNHFVAKTGCSEKSWFATKWFLETSLSIFGSLSGHNICRAQVTTTLGFPSGSKNWPFKRFSATMLKAMRQQKRSKRTTSNSIDWFLNQICPIFPSWSLHIKNVKNMFFRTFWGLSGGRRSRFYKRLCTRVSLQNITKCSAWQKSSRN